PGSAARSLHDDALRRLSAGGSGGEDARGPPRAVARAGERVPRDLEGRRPELASLGSEDLRLAGDAPLLRRGAEGGPDRGPEPSLGLAALDAPARARLPGAGDVLRKAVRLGRGRQGARPRRARSPDHDERLRSLARARDALPRTDPGAGLDADAVPALPGR